MNLNNKLSYLALLLLLSFSRVPMAHGKTFKGIMGMSAGGGNALCLESESYECPITAWSGDLYLGVQEAQGLGLMLFAQRFNLRSRSDSAERRQYWGGAAGLRLTYEYNKNLSLWSSFGVGSLQQVRNQTIDRYDTKHRLAVRYLKTASLGAGWSLYSSEKIHLRLTGSVQPLFIDEYEKQGIERKKRVILMQQAGLALDYIVVERTSLNNDASIFIEFPKFIGIAALAFLLSGGCCSPSS